MLLWQKWVYGLGAAIIGGGAGAVSAGFATMIVDPSKINIHAGAGNLLEVMGITFLLAAATHACAYLAQSPLPAVVSVDTTTVTVTKEIESPTPIAPTGK